jgi:hypothetical protein
MSIGVWLTNQTSEIEEGFHRGGYMDPPTNKRRFLNAPLHDLDRRGIILSNPP